VNESKSIRLAYVRSLQKVQGHRAGVVVDVTLRTGGPVGHAPNPMALYDTQRAGKEIVKRPTSEDPDLIHMLLINKLL